jgi:hypothetical protein
LVFGFWFLVFGFWFLVFGFWFERYFLLRVSGNVRSESQKPKAKDLKANDETKN